MSVEIEWFWPSSPWKGWDLRAASCLCSRACFNKELPKRRWWGRELALTSKPPSCLVAVSAEGHDLLLAKPTGIGSITLIEKKLGIKRNLTADLRCIQCHVSCTENHMSVSKHSTINAEDNSYFKVFRLLLRLVAWIPCPTFGVIFSQPNKKITLSQKSVQNLHEYLSVYWNCCLL